MSKSPPPQAGFADSPLPRPPTGSIESSNDSDKPAASAEPLLATSTPPLKWQPEKRHHRHIRHSVPSETSTASTGATMRPLSPKKGYLPMEQDPLSENKDHPVQPNAGKSCATLRVRMCITLVSIIALLLLTFILFVYLRPQNVTFPIDDHAPFLVRLMEKLSQSPSTIPPGTIVVDLDRLSSNFQSLMTHVRNNTAMQTIAVPSFPLLRHMLGALQSRTVVVANVPHLQPVVSDNLNVIYRGPNVVETARDNPAPGLITWVIASHHQIEAMKLASQSLSIKYKIILEAGGGNGFRFGEGLNKAVKSLTDSPTNFEIVGLYCDGEWVVQRPANEFWHGRQMAIQNSHDSYLRQIQEIYDDVAPVIGNVTIFGSSVSLATLNSTVETTFKLIHVLGRCVFKSAQCDELTTQQLLPAEFVIGIVSKEIKRDKGWFDWLISQIDASNLYEISTGTVSHHNLEAVYPASLSYHEGTHWKMPAKLFLAKGDFIMYRMRDAVEAPVMAHSAGNFQLWSSR